VLLTGYAGNDPVLAGGGGAGGAAIGAECGEYELVRKPVTGEQLAVRIAALLAVGLTPASEA
jgi:hypothetical protein